MSLVIRRLFLAVVFGLLPFDVGAQDPAVRDLDQGPAWTSALRAAYYTQDQGAQLIPLAWLRALHQANGAPFLADGLSRYGYLGGEGGMLPIGFTTAASPQGTVVGMTCAACHVRQLVVDHQDYRIDGGPAFADFQAMVADLDTAVHRVLADDTAFHLFAAAVLGSRAKNDAAVSILHADVDLWWTRYHTLMDRSLPKDRPWGPARLDAISMIYNRLAGLDLGAAPTYLIPENIEEALAPARYPFLWNSSRQDFSQWAGFAANGNDFLALTRNLGQLYGVFGTFHPRTTNGMAPLDRDDLSDNSANFVGLATAESLLKAMGPPVWPWPIDGHLAKQGEAVFNRPTEAGGCVACHGEREGLPRPPSAHTLKTPILDVGTDTRQWQVVLRRVKTGRMEGASIPGVMPPLGATDQALRLLKVSVVGTIIEAQAVAVARTMPRAAQRDPGARLKAMTSAMTMAPHAQMDDAMRVGMTPKRGGDPIPATNVYEARVLHGIWAAAPYLHNGSVPTLADLLEPAAARPRAFAVGPVYDLANVGLARGQAIGAFTLHTTGCDDRASGDSNCGHDYGTRLPAAEKKALLEYLKTL